MTSYKRLSGSLELEQCAVHAHEIVFFSREAWTVLPWRAFWIGVLNQRFKTLILPSQNKHERSPRWRLESPLVAETSPRRLLETSRVSGESLEIQTCSIFWRLFSVSSRSRRRLRDVSISCGRRRGDVSATSPRPVGDQGDWGRRCGDYRRCRGDVPATSGRIGCHLVWRRPSDVALASPWWERNPFSGLPSRRDWSVAAVAATSPWWERKPFFWSSESPELPRLISRGSRGDVSASEIGPLLKRLKANVRSAPNCV